jgi:hypothetical protein
MLCEDTAAIYARLVQAGLTAGVPASKGNPSPQEQVPASSAADLSRHQGITPEPGDAWGWRCRCPRAATGHAAALPSPAMNCRLFIE